MLVACTLLIWQRPVFAVDTPVSKDARRTYLVRFAESGAAHYDGSTSGLARSMPEEGQRFDAHSAASQAYVAHLRSTQAAWLKRIEAVIERTPRLTHEYLYARSGVALELSAAEASRVAALLGAESVQPDVAYWPATYRAPTFIGADNVWALSPPPPATSFGRGKVLGLLDSGIDTTHRSFANDLGCGFSAVVPKVRSARDCTTAEAGICNGPNPGDELRHGTSTAGAAVGNYVSTTADQYLSLPAPYTSISGVAPCATLRSYDVCSVPGQGCVLSAMVAAVDNVLVDGDVDVVLFGLEGGETPWTDVDRALLDLVDAGVVVVGPAGNKSAASVTAGHRAPWMLSTAASSHDEAVQFGSLSAIGPGVPPPELQSVVLNPFENGPFGNSGSYPIRIDPNNLFGCTASGGFPDGHFDGAIALVAYHQSSMACSFTEKSLNAQAAGAEVVVFYGEPSGSAFGFPDETSLPAYTVGSNLGPAFRALIEANLPGDTFVDMVSAVRQGNVLSFYSRRGPLPDPLVDLSKPDLTAPGHSLIVPYPLIILSTGYIQTSGTSLSAAIVGGAAVLLRALRPDWSATATTSALQLSASPEGTEEDRITPWNPDQVGHGLVRPDLAIEAGLVMDESFANFLAANPTGGSISVRNLNIPSLRNLACTPTCVFSRTFTGTIPGGQVWLLGYEGDPDINVQFSAPTFSVTNGGDETVTFTVSPNGPQPDTLFGAITLTAQGAPVESPPPLPVLRLTVAIAGNGPDANYVFANGFE
ncbi:MAG: S8 family serine peptidase [Xanthomonadales bacterium]|nr:S8 family serine peptidase [Xanthomonadales bacterium]